ncbi:precorrin-2 dehydrogenase / sirohydrochlorin ferrochelatase [Malonomonas rubra DSM 5091]|uniref:precorrin-2 dehydrogenase n=1 Tax=Malonomonas rubra DSM 5091 TaxID=1122189 RepID=A0A1M6FFW2_MALRU|nr:bifunctional precorrin-2 dehydrogenase/sirohydrochlorin ferrochelatase [Malonomonas rubra]SHI96539.1 precorrin-2 dehydrogenase / sirohydrochlorin ferrochelatase [Malonomonas rubra DSM 5091]
MSEARASFGYPIFLDLQGRLAVVVGAGPVGLRKVDGLLQAGAQVRLIDPQEPVSCMDNLEFLAREFEESDLQGATLVFACTDKKNINAQVADAARRQSVFCCRADLPEDGDFALPALFRQGALTVAVSTGGGSPTLAAEMRDRLQRHVPDCWGVSLDLMAAVRRKWLTLPNGAQYNQQVLRRFWAEQLLPQLEQKNRNKINQLLIETFGKEFSLEQLQVQLPEGMS